MSNHATIVLRRVTDATDEVTVERLSTFDRRYVRDGAFVKFEGRDWPTGVRSTTQSDTRPVMVTFGNFEQAAAHTLIDFLERAAAAADARLEVEPDVAIESELDAAFVAEVHKWELIHRPAGVIEVAFELTRVG